MAKNAFNLGDYLKAGEIGPVVSDSDTAPKVELIDIDLIDSNDANFYELTNLEPLMDSIAMDGIQQPLIVTDSPEAPDRVLLISGHRRREAVKRLVNDPAEPRPDLRKVPCIRRTYSSPAMAELQLIYANSTARILSPAELSRQAERVEELFYQLKSEGREFPGRMRDHVAAACSTSASKLARLKVIRKRLEPEFLQEFEAGGLSEDAAYKIAQGMDTETQRFVIEARTAGDKPLGLEMPAVLAQCIIEGFSALGHKVCEGCPKEKCDTTESMRLRTARISSPYSAPCEGCLHCVYRWSCEFACSLQKERAEAEKARKEERAETARAEREAKGKEFAAENRTLAQRLKKICGGDLSMLDEYSVFCEDDLKAALSGKVTDWLLSSSMDIEELKELAQGLNASADYILGLTDCPQPYESMWRDAAIELPLEGSYVLALSDFGHILMSVFFRGQFMDCTEYSVANRALAGVKMWAPAPVLPAGMSYPAEEMIKSMCGGERDDG